MDKQTRRFKPRAGIIRVAPEVSARHGRIATRAFLLLGRADAASLYLNTHDEGLGGRPLDIAGESDAGFAIIDAAIVATTLRPVPSSQPAGDAL